MAAAPGAVVRNRIINTLRAIALPESELRRLAPSFISVERMVCDDLSDDFALLAQTNDSTAQGVFDADELRELRRIEPRSEALSVCIYNDRDTAEAWSALREQVVEILDRLGWHGTIDSRQYG